MNTPEKTPGRYIKEAEAASIESCGEIWDSFVIGYLSSKILTEYRNGYNDGFEVGCAAERGIRAMQSKFDELDAEPEGGAL